MADAAALARVNIAAWQAAYAGIVPLEHLPMEHDVYTARWQQTLADPAMSCLVAERDGELVGYAVHGRYRVQQDAPPEEDTAGLGELFAIYVQPEEQGRGAGTTLHDAALAALSDAGHAEAALWVLEDNAAGRAWYARRGWLPDGAVSRWEAAGASLREVRLRRPVGPRRP